MFRGIGNYDDAKQFTRQLHQTTGTRDSVDNWLPSKGLKSEILAHLYRAQNHIQCHK